AAAGIANSPLHKTGITAFRISIAAYLIPFAFALSPAMLLQEGGLQAAWSGTTALIGAYALAAAVIGYQNGLLAGWQRGAFFVVACALVYPGPVVSAVALVLLAGLMGALW